MKFFLRLLLALALVAGPISSPVAVAYFPHGAVDTLLVIAMGDSNSGSGECFDASLDTLSSSNIIQLKHDFTTAVAREPLDQTSMGTSCGANVSGTSGQIGPTTKLVQLLAANGKIPNGVTRVVIIPTAWAGTGVTLASCGYWNPASTTSTCPGTSCTGGCALQGGSGLTHGFYSMLDRAKATWPNNKIWFYNYIMGANDGSVARATVEANIQALFTDIQSHYPDAAAAPILMTGIPPDRTDVQLGDTLNLGNVVAALQNIGTLGGSVSKAHYIDPTSLHSYFNNAWVHFNAASHRAGADNSRLNISTSIASGSSYNSGTGDVTLNLTSATTGAAVGSSVTVSGATGTGSFASINGTVTVTSVPSSTQIVYNIASGLTMTITNNATGSADVANGRVWKSTVSYAANGAGLSKVGVLGSDNFVYTCLVTGCTGSDPTTDAGVHWAKNYQYGTTVTNSLAQLQYNMLVSLGF